LAWRTADDIVAGRVPPASGASEFWSAYERLRDNGDLRIFVGLASMLEDHSDDAERIEADIVLAARELLARPAPRRWIKLMALRGRAPVTQTVGPDDIEFDLDALYLSGGLRSDLARWNARFEAVLAEGPKSGGFDSEDDAESLVDGGQHLVSRLQKELGAGYHVEYMPAPIRPPGGKFRARQKAGVFRRRRRRQ